MTPERYKKVSHQIESICEQGCSKVTELLNDAENGNNNNALSEFSRTEVDVIIDELNEIMAVYESKNVKNRQNKQLDKQQGKQQDKRENKIRAFHTLKYTST